MEGRIKVGTIRGALTSETTTAVLSKRKAKHD